MRRLSARILLALGLTIWLVGGTLGSTRAFGVTDTLRSDAQFAAARAAGASATAAQRVLLQNAAIYQQTSAATVEGTIQTRRLGFIAGWPSRVDTELTILKLKFPSFWFLEWLGAMITGMGLYKSGYLTNTRPTWAYVSVAIIGYSIDLPLVLAGLWHVHKAGFAASAFALWLAIPYTTEVLSGTLANTSVLLLLVRSEHSRQFLGPVASVGRTAFSNYILTTLLCQFLFAWGPWKLYGKLEYYECYLVVGAIWIVNLVASSLWLRVFAFGPLEWLWRSLTYWKRQRMLRAIIG
ncbi:DUF418 domain-containing protein [Acidisarcina polymorpha]|uniref:DUF418 domain-containing protein n=1 Tax=Acidisarcina polymorpha TaxID=2211140 RepID=UPI00137536F9|nr:DUF418 domain-containing protein [Acidisarcina polymorpha]